MYYRNNFKNEKFKKNIKNDKNLSIYEEILYKNAENLNKIWKKMKFSIILLLVLFFVVTFLHKPFNIHKNKTWIFKFHEILEWILIIQGMIVLNEFFKLI